MSELVVKNSVRGFHLFRFASLDFALFNAETRIFLQRV